MHSRGRLGGAASRLGRRHHWGDSAAEGARLDPVCGSGPVAGLLAEALVSHDKRFHDKRFCTFLHNAIRRVMI